jgi:hypothetical protein
MLNGDAETILDEVIEAVSNIVERRQQYEDECG